MVRIGTPLLLVAALVGTSVAPAKSKYPPGNKMVVPRGFKMVTYSRRTLPLAERECEITYKYSGSPYDSGLAPCVGVNTGTVLSKPSIQLLVPDKSISGRKLLNDPLLHKLRLDVGACALRALHSLRQAGIWGAEIHPEHMLCDADNLIVTRQDNKNCMLAVGWGAASTTVLSAATLKAMASSPDDPYGLIRGRSDQRGLTFDEVLPSIASRWAELAVGAVMFESLTGYKTPLEITHTSKELSNVKREALHSKSLLTTAAAFQKELAAIVESIERGTAAETAVGLTSYATVWNQLSGNHRREEMAKYSLMLLAGADNAGGSFIDSEINEMMSIDAPRAAPVNNAPTVPDDEDRSEWVNDFTSQFARRVPDRPDNSDTPFYENLDLTEPLEEEDKEHIYSTIDEVAGTSGTPTLSSEAHNVAHHGDKLLVELQKKLLARESKE